MARPKPSSAANGRLSQGPTTKAGKDRSRFNAVVHGLTARRLMMLKHESREEFCKLATGLGCTFTPGNTAEKLIVETIIADEWRLRRAQSMATVLMQDAFNQADPDSNPAEVICQLAESQAFHSLNRYEAQLQNALDRSTRRLAFIRKNFPDAVAYNPEEDFEDLEPPAPEEKIAPPLKQTAAAPQPIPVRTVPAFAATSAAPHADRPDPHLATESAKAAA